MSTDFQSKLFRKIITAIIKRAFFIIFIYKMINK